jgi:hypothetical protein
MSNKLESTMVSVKYDRETYSVLNNNNTLPLWQLLWEFNNIAFLHDLTYRPGFATTQDYI